MGQCVVIDIFGKWTGSLKTHTYFSTAVQCSWHPLGIFFAFGSSEIIKDAEQVTVQVCSGKLM